MIALIVAAAITAWCAAMAYAGHRHAAFLDAELARERASRVRISQEAFAQMSAHQADRSQWAEAAADERKQLLERLDIAYANLSQAAFTQPATPILDWPHETAPTESEETAERARRVAAAQAIEAELNARVNGIDDYSLRAEGV